MSKIPFGTPFLASVSFNAAFNYSATVSFSLHLQQLRYDNVFYELTESDNPPVC